MHYKDSRVYADQWEHLIKYWAIEDVKVRSDKNKASRAERKYNHTTGTKIFPRVRKEQATTTSSPLDMVARHQAWSLSSIQDTSLTQVGDIVVLKSIIRPTETVAIEVLKSTDASKEVEGEELGPDYLEIQPIKPNESLIRSYGLIKTVRQAIGAHVAWPAPFVISQVVDASREYLHK